MINNLDELLKLPEVELLKYLSENYTEQEIFELLDLTQDYADEEESRFFLYKPTPMAMLFHCSPAKIRWQYGANGSSKTIANIMEAHIQCSKMIPKSLQGFYPEERLKGSVICTRFITVDYPNGIEKIVKPLMQAFAPCKLEYSEDLRIFTYPNGAQCELMTYVQEIQAFMGVSRKLVIYDEEPPEHIHKENSARVARGDGQICASMTPESGITWSFDSIYQKAGRHYISVPRETLKDLNGNQVVKDGIPQLNKYSRNREIHAQDNPAGNPEIVTFHPTMYDNPYLSDSKINFMRTLCLTPEQEAIKVFGEFVSFTGLVLPEYNSSVNDYSPDLIQLEPDYPRYLFIDPHPQLPWAISLFCVDPRGIAYQEDELWVGGTMTDIVNAIKIFENMPVSANGKTGIRWIRRRFIDPSSKVPIQEENAKTTVWKKLKEAGIYCAIAPKDKVNGIILWREALKPQGAMKEPKWRISTKCIHTKTEIVHWSYPKGSEDMADNRQKPKDGKDHFCENGYRFQLINAQYAERNTEYLPLDQREFDIAGI